MALEGYQIWFTKEGSMPVSEMTDTHIENALRLQLKRLVRQWGEANTYSEKAKTQVKPTKIGFTSGDPDFGDPFGEIERVDDEYWEYQEYLERVHHLLNWIRSFQDEMDRRAKSKS